MASIFRPDELMNQYHRESEYFSAKYGFSDDHSGINYEMDAFRHAYSSAVMTYDYNRLVSRLAGDAHEMVGLLYNMTRTGDDFVPYSDTNMDEWNNYIGRDIGSKAQNREEIAQQVADALNSGKLITDKTGQIDKRQYPFDLPSWIPYSEDYKKADTPRFTDKNWQDNGYQCLAPWVKERQKKNNGKYHVYDPLALDLDDDGIETVATKGFAGALFDHRSQGIRTATGWISADDGLLVRDLNGNGIIDNGAELFGDNTKLADGSFAKHGYAALAELDSNGDGIVSAADAAFQTLRVWQDLNQDGISQTNELRTLEELGIQSLDVAYKDVNKNLGNGNTLAQQGSYTKKDGTTAQAGDLLLAADNLYSRFKDKVELTAEQAKTANLSCIRRLNEVTFALITNIRHET